MSNDHPHIPGPPERMPAPPPAIPVPPQPAPGAGSYTLPSGEPTQELGYGDITRSASQALRRHWATMLCLILPLAALLTWFVLGLLGIFHRHGILQAWMAWPTSLIVLAAMLLLAFFEGLVSSLVLNCPNGGKAGFGHVAHTLGRHGLKLVALGLFRWGPVWVASAIFLDLGQRMLVVPGPQFFFTAVGLFFLMLTTLGSAVVVTEEVTSGQAWSASWKMTRRAFGQLAGEYMVSGILAILASGVFYFVFFMTVGMMSMEGYPYSQVEAAFALVLWAFLATLLGILARKSAITAVIYRSRRGRVDGGFGPAAADATPIVPNCSCGRG